MRSTQNSSGVMFCPLCGKELKGFNNIYCINCGSTIEFKNGEIVVSIEPVWKKVLLRSPY